jgi:hypothetical protein
MYEYRATLLKIVDGDTVDVDIDLGFGVVLSNQRIRLYGIDTPESRTRDLEEKNVENSQRSILKTISKLPPLSPYAQNLTAKANTDASSEN